MTKWLHPHGFTGKVHNKEAKVGGDYRMSFTNFSTGKSDSFGGTCVELTPGTRLRYTDKFEDPSPSQWSSRIALYRSCQVLKSTMIRPEIVEFEVNCFYLRSGRGEILCKRSTTEVFWAMYITAWAIDYECLI